MPKEFDIREEMENQADVLRQNEQSSGIPQWMRENLETQPQERSLPAWVKANLEGNRERITKCRLLDTATIQR